MLIAIDPGPARSALVMIGAKIEGQIYNNDDLLKRIRGIARVSGNGSTLVIEMIASYGMPVGKEVFETCVMIGQLVEAWHPNTCVRIPRLEVKRRLCHNTRANDSNIRAAIIDRFGGKDAAIGLKKHQGPLYGFHADLWAALAVGMTYLDERQLTPVNWSPASSIF